MLRSDIHEGNTVITRAVRGADSLTAVVTSTRGTVKCKAIDENGKGWNIPYSIIIACSKDVKAVKLVKAVVGDVIQTKDGEKYRVDKVNSARYATTRLSDGNPVAVPHTFQFVILEGKTAKLDAQRAYLMGKGFTPKDVAEFERLFPTNP